MIEPHEEERPEGEDEIQLPEALQFLFTPSRYKVPYGGRGSAKSHSVARALLILCASTQLRVLCGREYQKSIQDSVHKLLSDLIESMGLQEYYKVLQYEIRSVMGGGFIFEGLHNNITKIKSIEGINIAWVEEAEKVSKSSWDTLIPTIRTPWLLPIEFLPEGTVFTEMELETGCRVVSSEIWVTFNPSEETDDTYKRFVLNPPPNCISRLINWRDNPWFPKELMDEKDWHFKTDPDGAAHVWEGQCRKMSAAQIMRDKYRVESFEPLPHWDGPYFGVDFGFAADPNAGVKLWVGDRCLWVEYEVYGIGVELDDTPGLFKRLPDIERHTSRADSSRPETISHCRRHGIPGMEGVDKWPGSVEDGIKYLRGEFECIAIHPRCIHTQQEMKLWSYKVDKNTEDILPIPEDKNNHVMDSIRYALAPMIKSKVSIDKTWWKYSEEVPETRLPTIRFMTIALDDVEDDAAQLRVMIQLWNAEGATSIRLHSERMAFGSVPELLDEINIFWLDHQKNLLPKPTELWMDGRSVGQSLIKELRRRKIPAREWAPDDKMVLDTSWRAKQASVHIANGRVIVPRNAMVVSEITGLATNAMSLALLIWQSRGGGK